MNGAAAPGKWADLGPRAGSAAVMIAIAATAIWSGGWVFDAVVVLLAAAMTWELARLTGGDAIGPAPVLALLTAASLALAVWRGMPWTWLVLVPPLALVLTSRRDRLLAAAWTLAVMMAGLALIRLREVGIAPLLWLVSVVVTSDLLGYFAGRLIGGPKFWPAISPKKTWSGTASGWIGAALVGGVFLLWVDVEWPWALILASPFFAFAGQMGDIAESWIKRRAGVKDASQLIPGHGGVMDRFDALTGAAALAMLLYWAGMVLGAMG